MNFYWYRSKWILLFYDLTVHIFDGLVETLTQSTHLYRHCHCLGQFSRDFIYIFTVNILVYSISNANYCFVQIIHNGYKIKRIIFKKHIYPYQFLIIFTSVFWLYYKKPFNQNIRRQLLPI